MSLARFLDMCIMWSELASEGGGTTTTLTVTQVERRAPDPDMSLWLGFDMGMWSELARGTPLTVTPKARHSNHSDSWRPSADCDESWTPHGSPSHPASSHMMQ